MWRFFLESCSRSSLSEDVGMALSEVGEGLLRSKARSRRGDEGLSGGVRGVSAVADGGVERTVIFCPSWLDVSDGHR
jgi:hypothetical protein